MENKKELTRLLIYLGFAFVLTWLVFFVFILTGHTWDYFGQDLQQLSGSDATNQNLQQLVGIILTYVTEKSGSIWPAAILHAVNNAGPGILSMYMNFGKVSGVWGETMAPWTGRMLSAAIFAIICFVAYAVPRHVSRCSA